MAWTFVRAKSWDHFIRLTNEPILQYAPYDGYYSRGQANRQWALEPSLARLMKRAASEDVHFVEEVLFEQFRAQAHAHVPPYTIEPRTALSDW